jgi:ABC-type Fe3+ transport system permease subunit
MKFRFPFLPLVAVVLAVLVSLPVASILFNIFQPDTAGVWSHLAETVLSEYVFNSVALALGTGLGAALLGTGAAWIVAMYRFPGRGVLEWALLLPLAMPTYVIAYAYTDFFQFAGPVQSLARIVWLDARRLLVSRGALAGRRDLHFQPGVLSLCLRAGPRRRSWSVPGCCWKRRAVLA